MHFHLEIVMPPTADIESAVKQILEPFNECPDDVEPEDRNTKYAFWDFYVIGGRSAGQKLLAAYEPETIDAFYSWLKQEKVTVSGLQCGKQELSPSTQIPKVDAKWNEMFPSDPPIPCPLFNHSNDQYGRNGNGTLPADVSTLESTPSTLKCSRVIIAGPDHDGKALEAKFMLTDDAYNGVNFMPVTWDGTLASALAMHREKGKSYRQEYFAKIDPQPDWLVVTVDYHS